jgi:signal transduction histidine kinase/ActR/RegA family two-component response regulator
MPFTPVTLSYGVDECAQNRPAMNQKPDERTLAALLDYGGRLAAAPTVEAVAAVVVEEGRGAVGATAAAVALLESPAGRLRVVAANGTGTAASEFRPADEEMAQAARAGTPNYRDGDPAVASLPLVAGERVIGAAQFVVAGGAGLLPRDRALIMLVSRQAADALQRAQLYAAEREARREAESANQMKDEFLATLSHELRTPLNAIMGWAHMLLHGSLDEATTRRALDAILRNAHAQSQLVGDVLDVSRIITGRLRLYVRQVDLRAVVRLALDAVAPAAAARNVTIELVAATGQTTVAGDADRLQQVVWNLVSNAVKFTPDGGRVEVTLASTDGGLELVVSDTGAGIGPEFLPRVFERFSQADASTRRSHGGLGLGLSIVRHLVELHGGTVAAESDGIGRGARFTVRLPVRAATRYAEEPPRMPVGVNPAVVDLRGVRVLVVDDEADARDIVEAVLRKRGAQVFTAGSVSEALLRLDETLPHLLVADIGMPGEDGYELIRRVRALPLPAGHIPAMALTAYGRPEDRARCLLLGYQMHVTKPIVPDDLVAAVERLRYQTTKA